MKMPKPIAVAICILFCSTTTPSVHSDTLYLKDGKVVFGVITSKKSDFVTINVRVELEPGKITQPRYRKEKFPRGEIVQIVHAVTVEQLQLLAPENPERYRDVAEEVASQIRDPEARDLALRLYLLGAKYGDAKLRQGCLVASIKLARSADEEMRLRALAFVECENDPGWLNSPGRQHETGALAPSDEPVSSHRKHLANALNQLRNSQRREAATTISKPWMKELMQEFRHICTLEQLQKWCAEPELKTEWLARTLELEIALTGIPKNPRSKKWSDLAANMTQVVEPVSFENVTRFNLRLNIFRDGKWKESSK